MIDLDNYDLIEKHFSGELSFVEKQKFDDLMQHDLSFAEEVQKESQANKVIHQLGLLETSNSLDKIHKKNKRANIQKKVLTIIAVSLTVGSLLLFSLNNVEEQDELPQKQFAEMLNSSKRYSSQLTVRKKLEIDREVDSVIEMETITIVNKSISEALQIQVNHDTNSRDIVDSIPKPEGIMVQEKSKIVTEAEINADSAVKENACTELILTDYTSEASCSDEENGSFSFSDDFIKGGNDPYKAKLYRVGEEEFSDVSELAAGNYFLEIVDANGCKDTINDIVIPERWCVRRIDDSFSPRYGETWEYPVIPNTVFYTFSLLDMNSVEVFQSKITEEELDWDGELHDGTIINEGIYILYIAVDGEIYYTGTITIVK